MFRNPHVIWMKRCLELAQRGKLTTPPNPMVGCVITHNNEWVAEGFHQFPGGPHAEVIACKDFTEKNSLNGHTVYVSLEPCSHTGKTPPCTDLLLHGRPDKVVVALSDPDERVAGRGLKILENAGIEVLSGILEPQARFIKRDYLTQRSQKRPYIILKWAQSSNGFLDADSKESPLKITRPETDVLVHRWRAEVQGITCGSNTWKRDKPALTVRHVTGNNPTPFCLTQQNYCPDNSNAILANSITNLFEKANDLNIISMMIEGGSITIQHFLESGLWDEIRMISGTVSANRGVKAPVLPAACIPGETYRIASDTIRHFYNPNNPCHQSLHNFDTSTQ
jgi:diaminohydroxyphosphoribosylaminopyrimidine deaminase / 5-amino-6-(5-phosphoribosylamino)uracil reductase